MFLNFKLANSFFSYHEESSKFNGSHFEVLEKLTNGKYLININNSVKIQALEEEISADGYIKFFINKTQENIPASRIVAMLKGYGANENSDFLKELSNFIDILDNSTIYKEFTKLSFEDKILTFFISKSNHPINADLRCSLKIIL